MGTIIRHALDWHAACDDREADSMIHNRPLVGFLENDHEYSKYQLRSSTCRNAPCTHHCLDGSGGGSCRQRAFKRLRRLQSRVQRTLLLLLQLKSLSG